MTPGQGLDMRGLDAFTVNVKTCLSGNEPGQRRRRAWRFVSALGCLALLALPTESSAAAQTVQCTGLPQGVQTIQTAVLVDSGAKTCVVISDSVGTLPATDGSMQARWRPANNNLFVSVRVPGASSDTFADYTVCDIPGGQNAAPEDCGRSVGTNVPLGSGTATFANTKGAEPVSVSVTYIANVGGQNTITAATATFGTPDAGATDSDNLGSQQSSLSSMAVNFQTNNLGDGVFGQLGNAFNGGGAGPQVTENGFSASTTSVANWVNRGRKQKLERQLASLPRDENGNDVQVAPAAYYMSGNQQRLWNAWIKGSWTYYDSDGSSFDGHTLDVLTGVDYKISPTVVMGLLAGYGSTDFNTVTGGTKGAFEADGYTVGPYGGVKLSEHLQLDGLIAYTYSDYDNRSGATKGDFKAHRVTVGAQLKGHWEQDNYFIEPGVRFMYAEEDQDAYTDSAGVRQSSQSIKAGRVSVGPKIGYTHKAENGDVIKPWVSVRGEYDFSNQGNVPSSGLPDLDDVLSARVSVGMDATTAEGLSVTIQGDISGLGGGEYTGYGGTARINVPF